MARIAVLGSNSFAGAVFVDAALAAGHDVLGVNRSAEPSVIFLPYRHNARASAYQFRQLDLNLHRREIEGALSEFRPHHVVDLAGQGMVAESWSDPAQWYETNIVAKSRIHEFLRRQTWLEKYVRVSTPEVYGNTSYKIREDHPYAPSTPYAVSHAAIDMSLAALHRNYGFPVVLARFANFFGPGQQLYRIIPRTAIYALLGKKLQLHGGGTSVRAFVYAADVARALLLVIDAARAGQTYHFSPQEFHSIREIVEAVCREVGVAFDRVAEVGDERPGKDQAYLMDSSRARGELGWQPGVSLLEGIKRTVAWTKDNLEEIKTLPLEYVHKP